MIFIDMLILDLFMTDEPLKLIKSILDLNYAKVVRLGTLFPTFFTKRKRILGTKLANTM